MSEKPAILMSVGFVLALHTRTPYTTYTFILFEDDKAALRVYIEVETGKGEPDQA